MKRNKKLSPAFFFTVAGVLFFLAVLLCISGNRSWWAYLGLGAALMLLGLTKHNPDIMMPRENGRSENAVKSEESKHEEADRWAKDFEAHEAERIEALRKKTQEVCAKLGICEDDIPRIKEDGYRRNYYDGVYHCNPNAPYCSVDNPREIGMEGCCTTLVFLPELGGWCLTDGLGNGWIR